MRFLVVGLGAIGTYVGASLAAAGHEVGFLARRHTAEVIAREGVVVERGAEPLRLPDVELFTDPGAALRALAWDVAVCALKSFDTPTAVAELAATGEPVPPVLSLQNGVDNEAAIGARLGPERAIAGTVTTAVSVRRPGHVVEERHRGIGVALGHPLATDLVAALDDARLSARGYPEAGPMKWSKLFGNLAGNATSAITDLPVAQVYADPGLFRVEARPVARVPRRDDRARARADQPARDAAGGARSCRGRAAAGAVAAAARPGARRRSGSQAAQLPHRPALRPGTHRGPVPARRRRAPRGPGRRPGTGVRRAHRDLGGAQLRWAGHRAVPGPPGRAAGADAYRLAAAVRRAATKRSSAARMPSASRP